MTFCEFLFRRHSATVDAVVEVLDTFSPFIFFLAAVYKARVKVKPTACTFLCIRLRTESTSYASRNGKPIRTNCVSQQTFVPSHLIHGSVH
mmetsp:Transcript_48207/g.145654  ORF Transcript_48207/g.145654 Transcript_48207/m.145654 type:complete len:91 (+) Transcript_48207:403-675(+)